MKKILSLLLVYLPLLTLAQGINFTEGLSWEQVKQKAKTENKYIFVDCYATWCGPCKYMDKNIYSNDSVGRFFNEKFISVKIQMDTTKSDNEFIRGWYAEASMIKSKYKVEAFPTYLFFSPNGNIIHRDAGAYTLVGQFMKVGSGALNSDKQYYTLLEKYKRKKLDTAYMKSLVQMVTRVTEKEGKELATSIANEYINQLSTDAMFTKENIKFIYENTKSSKDRGFIMFRNSAKRIGETDEQFSEVVCKNIVLGIINNEEIKPYTKTKKGKPDWKKIKSNLKKYGSLGEDAFVRYQPGILFKAKIEPELKLNSDWNRILPLIGKLNLGKNAEFVVGSTVVYYLNGIASNKTEKDCKNLVAAATYYADSFPSFLNANALNTWSWILFEHSNDKDELSKGLVWSKRSLDLEPESIEFIDTYANLLYKLGRKEEAISWQKKAVQKLTYNNPSIKKNLEKMQKGEKTWPDK